LAKFKKSKISAWSTCSARRLEEAHKLIDEVANVLTEVRRDLLRAGS
jgi:hypothetical protein